MGAIVADPRDDRSAPVERDLLTEQSAYELRCGSIETPRMGRER
jgi:hypothetical protein